MNMISFHFIRNKCRLCHYLLLLVVPFSILLNACNTPKNLIGRAYRKMSATEKQLADSLLLKGLDNEALYTLADTLKPMSSVQFYRMPILSIDKQQRDSAQQAMVQLQNLVNKISVGGYQFVLNPFERTDSIYRNIEIYVFKKSTLQKLINSHTDFYAKWGITPTANPASVLAITEYEKKYERWRSYGYLFGYPNYAVDFFVEAGKSQDSTKEFVKRDFFAIPVYAGETGHFTYATPKGYLPTTIDSLIYNKALLTLSKYTKARKKYTNNGQTKAFKIFKKLN